MKKKILGILIFVLFFGFIFADEFIPEKRNSVSNVFAAEFKGKKATDKIIIYNGCRGVSKNSDSSYFEIFFYVFGLNDEGIWDYVGFCKYNRTDEQLQNYSKEIEFITKKNIDSYKYFSLESYQLKNLECTIKKSGKNLVFYVKNGELQNLSTKEDAVEIDFNQFTQLIRLGLHREALYKFDAYIGGVITYPDIYVRLLEGPGKWDWKNELSVPTQKSIEFKLSGNREILSNLEYRYDNKTKYTFYMTNTGSVVDIVGLKSAEEGKLNNDKENEALKEKEALEKAEKNKRIDAKGKEIAKGYIYHGVSEGGKNSELFDSGALETGHAYYIPAYIVYAGGSMGGAVTNLFYNPNWQIVTYASQKVKGEVVGASKSIFGELPVSVIVAGGKAPTFIPVVLGLIED